MQIAVIEFARNVGGLTGANSTEFDEQTAAPGDRPPARAARRSPTRAPPCGSAPTPACSSPGTKAAAAYGATEISERHRHRYEVNNDYRELLDVARPGHLGHLARRAPGRDDRAARPPVLRGLPVPPRVQVAAAGARTRCSGRSSPRRCGPGCGDATAAASAVAPAEPRAAARGACSQRRQPLDAHAVPASAPRRRGERRRVCGSPVAIHVPPAPVDAFTAAAPGL